MTTQPILGGDYAEEESDQKSTVVNDLANRAAHAGFLVVQSKSVTDPTTLTPSNGEAWVVAGSATDAWTGHDHEVAMYYDGWIFRDLPIGEVFSDLSTGTNGTIYVKADATPTYTSVQAF